MLLKGRVSNFDFAPPASSAGGYPISKYKQLPNSKLKNLLANITRIGLPVAGGITPFDTLISPPLSALGDFIAEKEFDAEISPEEKGFNAALAGLPGITGEIGRTSAILGSSLAARKALDDAGYNAGGSLLTGGVPENTDDAFNILYPTEGKAETVESFAKRNDKPIGFDLLDIFKQGFRNPAKAPPLGYSKPGFIPEETIPAKPASNNWFADNLGPMLPPEDLSAYAMKHNVSSLTPPQIVGPAQFPTIAHHYNANPPDVNAFDDLDTALSDELQTAFSGSIRDELNTIVPNEAGLPTFESPNIPTKMRVSQPFAKKAEELQARPFSDVAYDYAGKASNNYDTEQDIFKNQYGLLKQGFRDVKIPGNKITQTIDDIDQEVGNVANPDAYPIYKRESKHIGDAIRLAQNSSGIGGDFIKQNRTYLNNVIRNSGKNQSILPDEVTKLRTLKSAFDDAELDLAEEVGKKGFDPSGTLGQRAKETRQEYARLKSATQSNVGKYLSGIGAEIGEKRGIKNPYKMGGFLDQISSPEDIDNLSYLTHKSPEEISNDLYGSLIKDNEKSLSYATRDDAIAGGSQKRYEKFNNKNATIYDYDGIEKELTGKNANKWKYILRDKYEPEVTLARELNKVGNYSDLFEGIFTGNYDDAGRPIFNASHIPETIRTQYPDMPQEARHAFGRIVQLVNASNRSNYTPEILKQTIAAHTKDAGIMQKLFSGIVDFATPDQVKKVGKAVQFVVGNKDELSKLNPKGLPLNTTIKDIAKKKKFYGPKK